MQQLPVTTAPAGAAPSSIGSPSAASTAGTTLFGIEFSTALFRAIQTALPTANGTELLCTVNATADATGLAGLPSLLANLTSTLENGAELPSEGEIFPFLGHLLPQRQAAEPQVPVADFVLPELPPPAPGLAIDTPTAMTPEITSERITLEIPFEQLLGAMEKRAKKADASQPVEPGQGGDLEALFGSLNTGNVQNAANGGELLAAADPTLAALVSASVPVPDSRLAPPQLLAEPGNSRRGSVLPLSFLPKESRLEVPRAVLGRFANSRTRDVDLPPPNLSMLTPAEQSAVGVSTEDRNATVLARIDRVEFVNRMTQALERARLESPKSIELELNPPSLGKLRIEVVDVDGQLTARIQTESSSARTLLLEHLPVLDRHLGEHGIEMQRLQVDHAKETSSMAAGGGNPDSRQNPQSQDQPRQQHPPWQWSQRNDEGERAPPISLAELLALAPGMDRMI
jgi:hypothetical protein